MQAEQYQQVSLKNCIKKKTATTELSVTAVSLLDICMYAVCAAVALAWRVLL